MSEIYLKFGKHKGEKLEDVPLKYFAWLLTKYEGSSLTKEELETEALRRGCEKRDGRWGISRTRHCGGFDPDGFGHGTMVGVIESYNDDATCAEDAYSYDGMPNSY